MVKELRPLTLKCDTHKDRLHSLVTLGIATVPLLNPSTLDAHRQRFNKTCQEFRVYKRKAGDPTKTPDGQPIVYVAGGFGALANPGAFHAPYFRELRMKLQGAAVRLFKDYIHQDQSHWDDERDEAYDPSKRRLEALFDRPALRLKGTKPTAEAWHRDETPPALLTDGDELFGGWINLDSHNQTFSCVPGSHAAKAPWRVKAGFAVLDKEMHPQAHAGNYQVVVPPGHWVVFHQHLVHEVYSKPATRDSYRLFVGFRLTNASEPLFPLATIFKDQAVPRLKSNQQMPMYATLHNVNFAFKPFSLGPIKKSLTDWSTSTFKDVCHEDKTRGSGKEKGRTYSVVHRFMKSLYDYRLEKYPEWTEHQKAIHYPHRSFTLDNGTHLTLNDGSTEPVVKPYGKRKAYPVSSSLVRRLARLTSTKSRKAAINTWRQSTHGEVARTIKFLSGGKGVPTPTSEAGWRLFIQTSANPNLASSVLRVLVDKGMACAPKKSRKSKKSRLLKSKPSRKMKTSKSKRHPCTLTSCKRKFHTDPHFHK